MCFGAAAGQAGDLERRAVAREHLRHLHTRGTGRAGSGDSAAERLRDVTRLHAPPAGYFGPAAGPACGQESVSHTRSNGPLVKSFHESF